MTPGRPLRPGKRRLETLVDLLEGEPDLDHGRCVEAGGPIGLADADAALADVGVAKARGDDQNLGVAEFQQMARREGRRRGIVDGDAVAFLVLGYAVDGDVGDMHVLQAEPRETKRSVLGTTTTPAGRQLSSAAMRARSSASSFPEAMMTS